MNLLMITMIRLMITTTNINHPYKVIATTPGGGSGDRVWSDRKEAEEGGNITAINIKSESGHFIGRIRTR